MLVLSPAGPSDAPLLTEIIRQGKAHWGYPAEWLTLWRDELAINADQIEAWHVRTAAVEGRLVGFFALRKQGEDWWLEHLWLIAARIGKGFGGELFRHAVTVAAELGADRLRIEAAPNAEGFYLHMGAVREGERITTTTGTPRVLPHFVYVIP